MENVVGLLVKYGLSAQQVSLYILLLKLGEVRVQRLADASGLARSSVYEHLKVLFKLGLAEEIIQSSHKMIRAYPVTVLRHTLNEKIADLQQLNAGLEEVEQKIALQNESPQSKLQVRYYAGLSGARQLMWNSLKSTNTVYVFSSWGRSRFVGKTFYENFVIASAERNIKEQVMVNATPQILRDVLEGLGQPTSRTKLNDIRALSERTLPIQGETFMYNNIYAQVYLKGDQITGFEIENEAFVSTQRILFESLWAHARSVSALI